MSDDKMLYKVKFSKDLYSRFISSLDEIDSSISVAYKNNTIYFFGDGEVCNIQFNIKFLFDLIDKSKKAEKEGSDIANLKDFIYDEGGKFFLVDFAPLSEQISVPDNITSISKVNASLNYRYIAEHVKGIKYRFLRSCNGEYISMVMDIYNDGNISINIPDRGVVGFDVDKLKIIIDDTVKLLNPDNEFSMTILKSSICDIIHNTVCDAAVSIIVNE